MYLFPLHGFFVCAQYTITENTRAAEEGVDNLKRIGVMEIKKIINHALTCFTRVLGDQGWESMVLDHLNEEEDEFEVEEDIEEEEYQDEDEIFI